MQVLEDYNDFDYRQNFWSRERTYEDLCDRLAIRKLLPSKKESVNKTIADICGGYGRLAREYLPYFKEVHLFDYAQNLLDQAREEYGNKLFIMQGSVYNLPYQNGQFNFCLFIRASHHFEDIESVLIEIKRVLSSSGRLIIEIANKRNLLEIVRFILGKSTMKPFDLQPTSRNEKGFYNYHPVYIEKLFKQNGFKIKKILAVSNFRNRFFKKIFGYKLLGFFENFLQRPLGLFKLSPSLYYLLEKG